MDQEPADLPQYSTSSRFCGFTADSQYLCLLCHQSRENTESKFRRPRLGYSSASSIIFGWKKKCHQQVAPSMHTVADPCCLLQWCTLLEHEICQCSLNTEQDSDWFLSREFAHQDILAENINVINRLVLWIYRCKSLLQSLWLLLALANVVLFKWYLHWIS